MAAQLRHTPTCPGAELRIRQGQYDGTTLVLCIACSTAVPLRALEERVAYAARRFVLHCCRCEAEIRFNSPMPRRPLCRRCGDRADRAGRRRRAARANDKPSGSADRLADAANGDGVSGDV